MNVDRSVLPDYYDCTAKKRKTGSTVVAVTMILVKATAVVSLNSANHPVLQENRMDALEKLLELDNRHNELLDQLAQLDAKISETLNDWISGASQQAIATTEKIAFPNSNSRIRAA